MPRQDPVQSADEQRKLRGQIQTLNEEARRAMAPSVGVVFETSL